MRLSVQSCTKKAFAWPALLVSKNTRLPPPATEGIIRVLCPKPPLGGDFRCLDKI